MAYYKVQNRQLIFCPVNCITEDGRSVFNYNLLPGPVLEGQGWKSAIVDDPLPDYDPDTQELVPWYEDHGTYIARRWETNEKLVSKTDKDEALKILGVEV